MYFQRTSQYKAHPGSALWTLAQPRRERKCAIRDLSAEFGDFLLATEARSGLRKPTTVDTALTGQIPQLKSLTFNISQSNSGTWASLLIEDLERVVCSIGELDETGLRSWADKQSRLVRTVLPQQR